MSAPHAAPAPAARPGEALPRDDRERALHEEVLGVVRAAVGRVLEIDPGGVTRGTRLVEDLRADSLALVEVVELVEEELAGRVEGEVHVDDDDLERLETVGDAVDHVVGLLTAAGAGRA